MQMIAVESGVRLAVTDINPKGGKTVVFLHGWPLAKEIFEYQADVLPRYGVRCVMIDLRGFGDSDKPWSGYSYNRLVEDVHRVLVVLNIFCCTLFGFSMGGAVAARYMARRGGDKRVCRLVLCGAAAPSFVQRPDYPYGKSAADVDALLGAVYQDRPKAVADFGRGCFYSRPSEAFLDWFSTLGWKASGYGTAKALEALRDEDLRADLARIAVPTAIFHGLHDAVCPYVFAGLMKESIKDSFIVPFERSGHALFYDEKEKCNTCLLEFLERATPEGKPTGARR